MPAGSLADAVDEYRNVRGVLERGVLPLATSVDGRPAVKLSDNPEKATGSASEVDRYLRVFGNAGRVRTPVHV